MNKGIAIWVLQLASIKARTLIVHGYNDFVPVAEAVEMHKQIPNAHLWVVPNGWHIPHAGWRKGSGFYQKESGVFGRRVEGGEVSWLYENSFQSLLLIVKTWCAVP